MQNEWTKEKVITQLALTREKGFIPVQSEMFRKDDGIVGQVLEREFGVKENNLHLADLGTYELKGMRIRKGRGNKVTLFHQPPERGLTTREIFERFCYVRPSSRDGQLKRKLFTTVKGNRQNNLGLILRANSENAIDLYWQDEYLSTWDLTSGKNKINQTILALAETQGLANSRYEHFHFVEAYLLSEPKDIGEAIRSGAVVMEFCVDQPVDERVAPHDRGPHVRIPFRNLNMLFGKIEQIL